MPRRSPPGVNLSWATVEAAERVFWEEIAAESETKANVFEVFKQYDADVEAAGRPDRYS